MAIGEDFYGRQSPFELLLDALDEDDSLLIGKGASVGPESLWPRACVAPQERSFFNCGAVEGLYAEILALPESAATTERPEKARLTADFAEIRKQLAGARRPDELRRLRRHCALAVHPDRVAPPERSLAEKFMAEINAAIDRAIAAKSTVTQTP